MVEKVAIRCEFLYQSSAARAHVLYFFLGVTYGRTNEHRGNAQDLCAGNPCVLVQESPRATQDVYRTEWRRCRTVHPLQGWKRPVDKMGNAGSPLKREQQTPMTCGMVYLYLRM